MDSLQLAIYHHNKAIDDSIRADSMMRARSNGIDAPVKYSAEDSLVYDAESGTAYLYGNSKVDYENMKLTSDKVHMNLDKKYCACNRYSRFYSRGWNQGKACLYYG